MNTDKEAYKVDPDIEFEISYKLEKDFKLISEAVPNRRFLTSPYITSSKIKITEEMVEKYGSTLKMGYHRMIRVVQTISIPLEKKYFNHD